MKCRQDKKKYKTFSEAWKVCVLELNKYGYDNSPYRCGDHYHLTSKYNMNQRLKKIPHSKNVTPKPKESRLAKVPPWKKKILKFVVRVLGV